jgi:cytochrome b561
LRAERYTGVAVVLHWAIALLILGQIAGGLFMHNLPNTSPIKFDLYQLHKSFGLTVLALSIARLGWRIANPPPPLPPSIPGWQRLIAKATHWIFYGLIIAIPLIGLAMVSVSPKDIPTRYFGFINIPHLGFLGTDADAEKQFMAFHKYLSFGVLGLFVLHVGAALKHAFVDRDGVMRSMAPAGAGTVLGIAGIFAALGVGVVGYYASGASAAPQTADDNAQNVAASTGEVSVCGAGAMAPNWDFTSGALRFIGEQNGRSFEGVFSEFQTEIAFDPSALDASWVRVTVDTGSASSGDGLRDTTMTGGEWFDVNDYPTATFLACDIRRAGDGYEAAGTLSIKDASQDIALPFTVDIEEDVAEARGGVDLVRTNYDLGAAAAWKEEEGVALGVRVAFEITAKREN